MSWCHQISSHGLKLLGQGCALLRDFSAKGCPLVKTSFIFIFITLLPYHGTVHTTERGSKLSVLLEEVTVHNTGISLLLSISVWVLLSSLIEWRETRPTAVSLMFLSTNGVAKEGRPNFNPRPGRGLNRDLLVGSQRSY